ncbi:hypothetical protein ACFQ1E_17410 [Sphingomonas canadensis]|uniref:Uncharacterized protein n=1 Tax=Sphingomonas canadensis TaxID=1219257 RepID=A0ABW3H9G8_9SPHN|nr:hypothetical protein [Sphingomonas canadensis]MCW3837826.1 hypothetical protein [Sphingomonas canadensis]
MKIENFRLAAQAYQARASLIEQRDQAPFGVTIAGRYQDDAMIAAVRPVIVAELDRRIAELDEDLRGLGVVVP